MRPVDVTYENCNELRQRLLRNAQQHNAIGKRRKARFSVGDRVRIEKHKHIFRKGYLPRFTNEIFTVREVRTFRSPHTYRIESSRGEMLPGLFYPYELCLVKLDPGQTYRIARIVDERENHDGELFYLVRWAGRNASHDTWVNSRDVVIDESYEDSDDD